MKVTVEDVLDLASRAESAGQSRIAEALFVVAGRMGRCPGGDGYDLGPIKVREGGSWVDDETYLEESPFAEHDPEPEAISAMRGRARLERMNADPIAVNHNTWEC